MKKWLSLLLIAVILLSMTACGGGGGSDKPAGNSDVDKLVSEYGFQWTDPTKPILNDKGAQEISFNVYSSKNASAKDYNDMKIMQDLYESTNVFVNWENVSESIYSQQKNLIFGNKDQRPDAIYHAGMGAGEILKYAKRKVLVPISDYLDYMPNFKKLLEERPDIKAQIVNVEDGKIYSLPRIEEMGLLQNPNILFLNKAWTQAAIDAGALTGVTADDLKDGLALKYDQMEALLTYWRDNDMNGNGKADDERPLSFVYNNWQGNQCDLYGMFGINDNLEHRIIVDGKVTYTVQDPRFKEATNFIADWVSKGLIDKASFDQSQDVFLANGKGTEKYGAFYWWESETVVSNPENYITCAPLIGPDGSQTVCISNNPEVGAGEVVIFSECQNVEVLLAYFDRYYDPVISAQINYGPIGIVYEEERDEKGMLVQKPVPEGLTADELRLQNAPLGIIYLGEYAWNNVVNMEPRAKLRLDRLTAYVTPYMPANVKQCLTMPFTSDELNVIANLETNLNDHIRTNLIKWILKGGVSDAEWDTFQKELTGKCKIDDLAKVYQDAYDRFQSGN